MVTRVWASAFRMKIKKKKKSRGLCRVPTAAFTSAQDTSKRGASWPRSPEELRRPPASRFPEPLHVPPALPAVGPCAPVASRGGGWSR